MASKGVVSILIQAKDDASKALRLVIGGTEQLAKAEKTAASSTRELTAAEKNLAEAQRAGFKSVKDLLAALDTKTTKLKAGAQAAQQAAAAESANTQASGKHSRAVQNEVNQLRGLSLEAKRVADQELRLVSLRGRLQAASRLGAQAQQQVAVATVAVGRAATTGAAGVGKIQNAFQQLAFGLSGIPGAAGRVISTLATFTLGGGWTLGVVAGITAIVGVWDRYTRKAREARQETRDLIASLAQAQKVRTGQAQVEENAKALAELKAARREKATADAGTLTSFGGGTARVRVFNQERINAAKARLEEAERAFDQAVANTERLADERTKANDPLAKELELLEKRATLNRDTVADRERLVAIERELNAQLAAGTLKHDAELEVLGKLATARGILTGIEDRAREATERRRAAQDEELRLLTARAKQSALTGTDLRRLITLENELATALKSKNLADAEQLRLRERLAAVQSTIGADPRLAAIGLVPGPGEPTPRMSRTERPVPVIIVGKQEDVPAGKKAGTGPDLREEPKIVTDIRAGLTGALSDFLARGISTFETLGQALANFGRNVVQMFLDIFAQIAAEKTVAGFLSFLGVKAPVKAAGGGVVMGPGTGTSDSIPALLSNGEGIIKADAVKRMGGPAAIDWLNSGAMDFQLNPEHLSSFLNATLIPQRTRLPRFKDGGVIGAATNGGAGITGNPTRVSVEASNDLVVRQIENGPGQRAVIKVIGANKRQIRAALGLNG
jgi:hypothetical protein